MQAEDSAKVRAQGGGIFHGPVESQSRSNHRRCRALDMLPGILGSGERPEGFSDGSLQGTLRDPLMPDALGPFANGQQMGVKRGVGPPALAAVGHDEGKVQVLSTSPGGGG